MGEGGECQAKRRASLTYSRWGRPLALPGVPTAGRHTPGPVAQARYYFVTSLRGGERGSDEPRGDNPATTSAAAGHLRGA